eukprot:TRINITY_DN99398_c0_g1_i1.p1 TRINITY_DN99398_c0_g1~~TRINITY_DN99398_c0_g1_i1.p1  ORF type:complete len:120 (-),score=18.18 TRINITY_DN99398_c0_g1_i1:225-584(-)
MSSTHTGLAVGRAKGRGYVVTKRTVPERPSQRKGKAGKRVALVREIVREVAGFAPYERRMMELIKIGTGASLKRALKFSKKRLGTHRRAKRKREEMQEAWSQRKKAAHAAAAKASAEDK